MIWSNFNSLFNNRLHFLTFSDYIEITRRNHIREIQTLSVFFEAIKGSIRFIKKVSNNINTGYNNNRFPCYIINGEARNNRMALAIYRLQSCKATGIF